MARIPNPKPNEGEKARYENYVEDMEGADPPIKPRTMVAWLKYYRMIRKYNLVNKK